MTAAAARYHILAGAPPEGVPLLAFSQQGGLSHRDDALVVQFEPTQAPRWLGSFARGLTAYQGVFAEPGTSQLIVVAGGNAYVVNPETRELIRTFGAAFDAVHVLPDQDLLFANGMWMQRLGPQGVRWTTERISYQSFRAVQVGARAVHGEASTLDGRWLPFGVELETGDVRGGALPEDLDPYR